MYRTDIDGLLNLFGRSTIRVHYLGITQRLIELKNFGADIHTSPTGQTIFRDDIRYPRHSSTLGEDRNLELLKALALR